MKHFLWHGNIDVALDCLDGVRFELDLPRQHPPAAAKLHRSAMEFDTYIRNNRPFIPNFGERYRPGTRSVQPLWNRRFIKS